MFRLLRPIRGPVVIEEAMSGIVVSVKLVFLFVVQECLLKLINLFPCRDLVVISEYAKHWHPQVFDVVHNNICAPQVGHRSELRRPCRSQQSVPSTRRGADHADFAVAVGLGLEPPPRADQISYDSLIRQAAPGPYSVLTAATVQIGADGQEAMISEASHELFVQLIAAGTVVHKHNTGEKAIARWPTQICVDLISQ